MPQVSLIVGMADYVLGGCPIYFYVHIYHLEDFVKMQILIQ